MTCQEYGDALAAAGFTAISVTITNDAGGGLHSAIIKAAKPESIAGSSSPTPRDGGTWPR